MKTASQPCHLKLRQVQNIQYHIDACYFVHMLYGKLLHLLGQRHQICVIMRKSFFEVYSLELHSIKKGILRKYHAQGRIYLHMMLFLMRVYLVHWNIHHNHTHNLWLCVRMCHTHLMLHLQGNKLAI